VAVGLVLAAEHARGCTGNKVRRLFEFVSRYQNNPPGEGVLSCPDTGVQGPVRVAHPNSRYGLETGGCPTHADCRFGRSSFEHQMSGGTKGSHNFKGKRCKVENERTDWAVRKAISQGSVKARKERKWLELVEEFLRELFDRSDAIENRLLYAEALISTNFDRYSMTSMPTNQILRERTGKALSSLRAYRAELEEFGWLGVVGGGRTADYADSGSNEAQVLVLTIPDWWMKHRAQARRARLRAAFGRAVDRTWHPHTLKSDLKKTTREGDTPPDGRAGARLPFGTPGGVQARSAGVFRGRSRPEYWVDPPSDALEGGPGVPDAAEPWGGDAHRASQAPERVKGRGSFFDDLTVAGQWLQAHVPALAEESLDRICSAIKAQIKHCGWDVSDVLDAVEWDPATMGRWRGGGLELAKYPARLLRWRLDQWGTKSLRQRNQAKSAWI